MMLNPFLVHTLILANLLSITLPQALQEERYVVPTDITTATTASSPTSQENFEWRLSNPQLAAADAGTIQSPRPIDNEVALDIDARSAMIMDRDTKKVLWQKNPDDAVPIASITKLMTALVWLDHQPPEGLEHVHTFAAEDDTPGGKELNLPYGTKLRTFDLLRSSLVGSDNDTAMALAHSTALSQNEFVNIMNLKARAIGMRQTTFIEPTGLEQLNMATPYDVALLAREAFSHRKIQEPASMAEHLQETVETKNFSRVRTTNKLLFDPELKIIGGKTGYTLEAGYGLVVQARHPQTGRDIIVVILGASFDQSRFDEAKKLILWTFTHYVWN